MVGRTLAKIHEDLKLQLIHFGGSHFDAQIESFNMSSNDYCSKYSRHDFFGIKTIVTLNDILLCAICES